MRRVPALRSQTGASSAHFLLIGDGRLARHLAHYLKLENRSFSRWSRKESPSLLNSLTNHATHALLAISDNAIEPFVRENSILANVSCVHFSGALSSTFLPSAHPLMTFGETLYSLETYRSIPFVLERERERLSDLLPGFTNESFEIESTAKPLYHALCTMSGNFTVLLWEKVFAKFDRELGLPRDILYPFLAQTAANLILAPAGKSVLTGPLSRSDFGTVEKHLTALAGDPFAGVYRAFVDAYMTPPRHQSQLSTQSAPPVHGDIL